MNVDRMRRALFWLAAAGIAYTYAAFPLIVLLRGWLRPRPYHVEPITPTVTMVIAARNEEEAIADKLRNIDGLDYPAELLEVVVASDGSEDRTEQIVEAHAGRPVTLLRLPRRGKAAALNAAIAEAHGEVIAFSDSNSRWAADALRRLVAPFADPSVGGVAGNQVYEEDVTDGGASGRRKESDGGDGERTYWSYDRLLKEAESRAGSTISATGAIYAVRRELLDSIPDGVTDDFYASVGVIAHRRRLVFASDAIAYERPAGSGRLEFRRKVRIMTRGLLAVRMRRDLLDPRRHGFYALQLASHKILRRLMAVPLAVLALLAPLLWQQGWVYRLATAAQALFYSCALAGLLPWSGARYRPFAVPAFVVSAVAASAVASWNVLRGRRIDRWEPARDR